MNRYLRMLLIYFLIATFVLLVMYAANIQLYLNDHSLLTILIGAIVGAIISWVGIRSRFVKTNFLKVGKGYMFDDGKHVVFGREKIKKK